MTYYFICVVLLRDSLVNHIADSFFGENIKTLLKKLLPMEFSGDIPSRKADVNSDLFSKISINPFVVGISYTAFIQKARSIVSLFFIGCPRPHHRIAGVMN